MPFPSQTCAINQATRASDRFLIFTLRVKIAFMIVMHSMVVFRGMAEMQCGFQFLRSLPIGHKKALLLDNYPGSFTNGGTEQSE